MESSPAKIPKLEFHTEFERWNFLPPEIKLKCIKNMDFEMRFNLSQTAQIERALIHSTKNKFSILMLCDDEIEAMRHMKNAYQLGSDTNRKRRSLLYILKTSKIQFLDLFFICSHHSKFDEKFDKAIENGSIKVGMVEARASTPGLIVMLKKCWDKIESLSMPPMTIDVLQEVFGIPSVLSTRKVVLFHAECNLNEVVEVVVQKWIENDVKFGTRLEVHCHFPEVENQTFESFENRKISFFNSRLRIRTDNDEKNILMFFSGGGSRFCCVVIRAKYTEQQCENYVYGF